MQTFIEKSLSSVFIALVLAACGGGGSSSGGGQAPPPTINPPPVPPTAQELQSTAKFLDLATFGPTLTEIESAAEQDIEVWLNQQFVTAASLHMPIVERYIQEYGADIDADPPPGTYRRFAFWEQALQAPDQLRQVTAYALTQIFVVSDNVGTLFIDPRALASYNDMLLLNAFGNFRDLLRAVTLHPAMGFYLSHVNNGRADAVANTFPDENYAREVMQLFSIGLFELNPNGTQVLDAGGNPIPTYDNADIREFSKIFTGLSYGPESPGGASFFGKAQPVLHVPMEMFEAFHEPGVKQLLNGQTVANGQSGLEDIDAAIDNLFNHPNTGPFIGRQLIQRLVTSNPSAAYIQRVSDAFAGVNGNPRGDMQAVLRAILTDAEALTGQRLREPFRRYLALNRSLGASTDDGTVPGLGFIAQFLIQQHVLSAPSVFNFYSSAFRPAGPVGDAGLVSPEFQITNASTIVGMTNLLAFAIYGAQSIESPDGFSDITLNFNPLLDVAENSDELIDRIDLIFFAGAMDTATRTAIIDAVEPITTDPIDKVRLALYLSLASPAYAVVGDMQ